MTTKILVKTAEYCSEGSCVPSYYETIMGVVNDTTSIKQLTDEDAKSHGYTKNAEGEWWNGLDYGWEIYTYEIKEIPVLN